MASSSCPIQDVRTLMWDWGLPDVLKLKEFCDIKDSYEEAAEKDQALKNK